MAEQPWTSVKHQLHAVLRSGALGGLSDSQLLLRFLDGGEAAPAAFEILVARHGPMVQSVCRQILGTTHDADDAFQATFLVLVRRASAIRKADSVASWLHGVARRICLRARQHARTRRLVPLVDSSESTTDPVGDRELVVSIHEEIARLPEHYRTPVLLCEIGGQTHAEAAAQLNCPIGTVSGRLSRAKVLLRERMTRRGLVASSFALATTLTARTARAESARCAAKASAILANAIGQAGKASLLARSYLAARLALRMRVGAAALAVSASLGGLMLASGGSESAPATPHSPTTERTVLSPEPRPIAAPNPVPTALTDLAAIVPPWGDAGIISVTVAPNGKSLALIKKNATITVWDIEQNRERLTYRGHHAPLIYLSFSPDGGSITTSDINKTLKVWRTESGSEQLSMVLPSPFDGSQAALIGLVQNSGSPSGS